METNVFSQFESMINGLVKTLSASFEYLYYGLTPSLAYIYMCAKVAENPIYLPI